MGHVLAEVFQRLHYFQALSIAGEDWMNDQVIAPKPSSAPPSTLGIGKVPPGGKKKDAVLLLTVIYFLSYRGGCRLLDHPLWRTGRSGGRP